MRAGAQAHLPLMQKALEASGPSALSGAPRPTHCVILAVGCSLSPSLAPSLMAPCPTQTPSEAWLPDASAPCLAHSPPLVAQTSSQPVRLQIRPNDVSIYPELWGWGLWLLPALTPEASEEARCVLGEPDQRTAHLPAQAGDLTFLTREMGSHTPP